MFMGESIFVLMTISLIAMAIGILIGVELSFRTLEKRIYKALLEHKHEMILMELNSDG